MLQYMLCVSRFAHFIKSIGRDRIGGYSRPQEIQTMLQRWLANYVTPDANASPEVKARYPLREANVQIQPKPGASGSYDCVMRLVPHYELDELAAAVRLKTEISPLKGESR
jgi:predicted component of type VI protein secretion system